MRCFLLLAILAQCLLLQAQVLTRDNLFVVGDSFQRLAVDASNLSPGEAGSGRVWDFSALKRTNLNDHTLNFVAPSATPFAASFPNANLVELQSNNDHVRYHYWKLESGTMSFEGFAQRGVGIPVVGPNQKAPQLLQFPASLGAVQTDNFTSDFSHDGQALTRSGTVTTTLDGSGTLILPGGSFSQVLRLKTVQQIQQQSSVGGLAENIITTSYAWYAPATHYPLFSLQNTLWFNANGKRSESAAWFLGGITSSEVDRYIPHLALYGGDFTSSLLIRNNGSTTQSLGLLPYTLEGLPGTVQTLQLLPGTVQRLSHEQLGTSTSHLGISGCSNCTVTVGYRSATGGGTGHANQTTGTREFLLYPGEWDVLFDGLALVNLGNINATVTGQLLDDSGAPSSAAVTLSDNLAPNAKLLANLAARFMGQQGRLLRISSSQPAAVLLLRGSLDKRFLYQNQPLVADTAAVRWLPHLAKFGGDFVSQVFVHNSGTATDTLTLLPYVDGLALTAVKASVAPGETRVYTHEELNSSAQLLEASGCASCVVSVGYRSAKGGGTAHIHQTQLATEWYAYPGEWEVLWDGLALANGGGGNAVFWADVLSDQGTLVTSAPLGTRADNNKLILNLVTLLAEFPNQTLRIRSDRAAALLLLRGSLDGRFLYHNLPL